jgi:hypothetical protein
VDTERDFLPVVSSFHQTYEANKRRSFILVKERVIFTHKELGGHYFRSRKSCWFPPHNRHKIQRLDKAFMGALKTFCSQEFEVLLRSNLGRASHYRLPNLRTI